MEHSSAKQGNDNNADIPFRRLLLQYALQSAAATFVNAKADYEMKNMKQLFKDGRWRGYAVQPL